MILAYTIPTEILPHFIRKTNCELDKLSDWFKANKLSLNLKKTNYIIFRARNKPIPSRDNLNVLIDSIKIKRLATTKFLGTYINEHLDWKLSFLAEALAWLVDVEPLSVLLNTPPSEPSLHLVFLPLLPLISLKFSFMRFRRRPWHTYNSKSIDKFNTKVTTKKQFL